MEKETIKRIQSLNLEINENRNLRNTTILNKKVLNRNQDNKDKKARNSLNSEKEMMKIKHHINLEIKENKNGGKYDIYY